MTTRAIKKRKRRKKISRSVTHVCTVLLKVCVCVCVCVYYLVQRRKRERERLHVTGKVVKFTCETLVESSE